MILLETHNALLEDTLRRRFEAEKREAFNIQLVDFDKVKFHISTDEESKDVVLVSLSWACFKELSSYGAEELLNEKYQNYIQNPPESSYDFTLKFDLNNLPEDKESLIKEVGKLKAYCFSAPFDKAFQDQLRGNSSSPMLINYREEEKIFIQALGDRVTVIFSTYFKEEMDQIFAKVFLQEFVDARRDPTVQNAPQVLYSNREPPLEIRDIQGVIPQDNVGYVTFVFNERHSKDLETREKSINIIQTFRDYLHYHIKCSKAYMHSRMRAKVSDFLKVLNRSVPDKQKNERKTASGRTFNRA
ncbi:P34-Arc-domain-containing protein [Neoconidiobolus thromboides FSU 785]|nr:P34-Arc-domain-containing protein [Neoconidiobolus thromboides FSU 785]